MAKNPKQHKEKLIDALERSLGIVTAACKEVGISRDTFYRYYNTDNEFKKKVDSINDFTLDFVENQLLKKIKEGSERSILFYMKYKGRLRGYTDTIDINANIKIEQPLLKPLDDDDINNSDTEDKED